MGQNSDESRNAVTLSDGGQMPLVGLGTWKIESDHAADLVWEAIRVGYRHLDCACDYGNESAVGRGLSRAMRKGSAGGSSSG